MVDIRYERFVAGESQILEDSLVDAYRKVFAGYPWFEDWPVEVVVKMIRRDITEDASCWVALAPSSEDKPYIVGFTWGFELPEKKLVKMADSRTLQVLREICGPGRIAYQSELGVLESFRGQGIARNLVMRRNQDFLERGLEIGVIRTKEDPPSVTYTWYQRVGYEIIYRYPDDTNRVLMASRLVRLQF